MPGDQTRDLPDHYYLDNFRFLLEFVSGRYRDLLTSGETVWCDDFFQLPDNAQRLYVRLIQRKGPLFRTDRLSYPEINSLDRAVGHLLDTGFADRAMEVGQREKLALLLKPELLALPEAAGLGTSRKKQELLAILGERPVSMPAIPIIRPLHRHRMQVFRLLFFGNPDQDLTEFVLHELGVTRYETCFLDSGVRPFQDRCEIDTWLALHALAQNIHEVIDSGSQDDLLALIDDLPERPPGNRTGRRHDTLVNRIARQCERLSLFEQALALYRRSCTPPSRERRVRILARLNRLEESRRLCQEMAEDPGSEPEQEFSARWLARHSGGAGRSGPAAEYSPPVTEVCLAAKPGVPVEILAGDWFRESGASAVYVENSLLPGIFGLAFWDIIFAPVRGAFFHPFQRGPADLFSPEFQQNRKSLIDARMAEITDGYTLEAIVLSHFRSKQDLANHFVDWSRLSEDLLKATLAGLPNQGLLSVFSRLLRDPARNRSGFPDLAVFHAGRCELVEVKGPGDRLQDNQRRWLHHFSRSGIDARVLRVRFDGGRAGAT